MNKPKKIRYIIAERDGETAEVYISKGVYTKEEAIKKMKEMIDDEPYERSDGTLVSEIECDCETMITSSFVWFIPV